MSRVRHRKIDCGPFGSFVLLDGELASVIGYLESNEEGEYESMNDGRDGFVASTMSGNIYLWVGLDADCTLAISHEALHMACSLLERIGVETSLACDACEEILATLTGYVSCKIYRQFASWQK